MCRNSLHLPVNFAVNLKLLLKKKKSTLKKGKKKKNICRKYPIYLMTTLIKLFRKHLLNINYVQDPVPGTVDKMVNKTMRS